MYRCELRKLRAQRRTYLGLAAAAIAPLIFVDRARVAVGLAERRAARARGARLGPRDPARAARVRVDLAVPADHGARGRRHRRGRGLGRHAQDDPHAVGRPHPDLRRQAARGAQLHAARARHDGHRRRGRGGDRVGLASADVALGYDRLGAARAAADRREPRDLPHPARGDHVHRRPALDGHAQQRGRRRRHADGRAALPAGPDPARARRRRPVSPDDPVRRLARLPAHARSTGNP